MLKTIGVGLEVLRKPNRFKNSCAYYNSLFKVDRVSASPLSNTIKRTSDLLRLGSSGQVTKYEDRFQSLRALHERLLSDFIISDFNNEQAYETAKQFFSSSTIRFARASYLTPNRGLYHNCTRKTKTTRPHTSKRKIYLEQTK